MKINNQFEYVANQVYEKKKLKDFREAHDINDPTLGLKLMAWLIAGFVIVVAVICAAGYYFKSFDVFVYTLITLMVIATLLFVVPIITRYEK